ncbi:MAG: cytochrome c family protein [Pseudomonadota bacterium]
MKRLNKGTIFLVIMAWSGGAAWSQISGALIENKPEEPYYVGMGKCVECHPEHVETYSDWKYSKIFRILEMRGKEHDPQCLPCHTTGYDEPGGFVSVEKTPHMKNVQCEACHGPASLHVDAPTVEEHLATLSIPINVCTKCHRQHKHMGY